MSAPDDIARRYDGEGVPPATPARPARDMCPGVMDAWAPHNRLLMRQDRLRDAWAIVRPALWSVAGAAMTWLLLHMATVAISAIADPLAGQPY